MVAKVCLNVPAALGLPPSRQGHLSQAPFPLRRPPLGAGTQDLPAPVLAAHPGLGDAFPRAEAQLVDTDVGAAPTFGRARMRSHDPPLRGLGWPPQPPLGGA